jgi:hypothetical protein
MGETIQESRVRVLGLEREKESDELPKNDDVLCGEP